MSARQAPVAPIVISDVNAHLVGMSPRAFRDFVREHHIVHYAAHRHVYVRADLLLATLDRLSGASTSPRPIDERETIALALVRRPRLARGAL